MIAIAACRDCSLPESAISQNTTTRDMRIVSFNFEIKCKKSSFFFFLSYMVDILGPP